MNMYYPDDALPLTPQYRVGDFVFSTTNYQASVQEEHEPLLPLADQHLEIATKTSTLEQAQSVMPFTILLPQWLPPGFTRMPEVGITMPPDRTAETDPIFIAFLQSCSAEVHLLWRREKGGFIGLDQQAAGAQTTQRIYMLTNDIDTLEEVRVHRAPVPLIRRAAGPTPELRAVFPAPNLRLIWKTEQLLCELHAASEYVSSDELVRVAESMPIR
ncbi:MAG: hypothetical protein U0074_19390 [Kouleothrix sp.]